jgi:hypothetical protein
LAPLIRAQVEEYIGAHFRDQTVVDVETTEAIAERFVRWGRWFLLPATILFTLLGLTLGLLGIRDFSDVHKASQQAISESNEATKRAEEAKTKSQEAETKSEEAIKAIDVATANMNTQLASEQQLAAKVSGLESKIADASKHVEGRVTELDKSVESANKAIAEQQQKLINTNELVTLLYSKGEAETFSAAQGNSANFAVFAFQPIMHRKVQSSSYF